MALKIVNQKGKELSPYIDRRSSSDNNDTWTKEIKSGTEVPEVLMSDSPLADDTNNQDALDALHRLQDAISSSGTVHDIDWSKVKDTDSFIETANKTADAILEEAAKKAIQNHKNQNQAKSSDPVLKETQSTTIEVMGMQDLTANSYALPIICVGCGFLMGILVSILFFRMKIKQVRKECEAKVNEARTSLDRVVQMVVNK